MTQNDTDCFESLQVISLYILGEPASKANSRKFVFFGKTPRFIKSDKARAYAVEFEKQCPPLPVLMEGDLRVTMRIFYASRRPDLDESLILDLMQGRVYENDRQVKERHIYWGLDKENPRSEIVVERIPEVAPEKKPRSGRGNMKRS